MRFVPDPIPTICKMDFNTKRATILVVSKNHKTACSFNNKYQKNTSTIKTRKDASGKFDGID